MITHPVSWLKAIYSKHTYSIIGFVDFEPKPGRFTFWSFDCGCPY